MWVGALMCLNLSMCLSAFLGQGQNANVLEVPLLSQVTGSVQDLQVDRWACRITEIHQ